jgi:hypothetical protein
MVLEKISDDIWIADGPTVSFYGFPYPTRMAIVRLDNDDLWVWSPIDLDSELRSEVEALGRVRHLVSPNKLHHLFLGVWAEAWPGARLHASPGLSRRRRNLEFDGELGDDPDPAWAGQIDQVVFGGSFAMSEVVFFHRRSSTCLVCDLVQRHDPSRQTGWKGRLMRLAGLVGPEGSTPPEWRLSFVNRRRARAAAQTALGWRPERLVIAHGEWAPTDGAGVLRTGLRWLVSSSEDG